ncbi:hypothetical protein C6H67_29275, partial [Klebsiella pneumoniae]
GRRRTPGLRREEVAQLASISPTWYTWLEQGARRGRLPARCWSGSPADAGAPRGCAAKRSRSSPASARPGIPGLNRGRGG